MLYTIALVKRQGYLNMVHWREHEDEEALEFYGDAKLVALVQTADRDVMRMAKIKFLTKELKDLAEHHNALLKKLDGSLVQDETYDLCCSVQATYINKIGRLVKTLVMHERGRNLFLESEPDEVVMQCYDAICKSDEAKKAYHKMDMLLNKSYHRSLMNAYC